MRVYGKRIAPQGVPVTITLKPTSSKTGQVLANSIIFGSLTIPIKASSEEITGRQITREENSQRRSRTAQLGQNVGGLLSYALNPSLEYSAHRAAQYYALGGLVGGLVDLTMGEESSRIVRLGAGHTLALKLEEDAPFNLPTEYRPQFPPGFNNPRSTPTVQALDNRAPSIIAPTHPEQFSRNSVHLNLVPDTN